VKAAAGRAPQLFEALPEGIIHAAHDAIVAVDEEQRIVMLNPAAERLFGCTALEALGSDVARFIPAPASNGHGSLVRRFIESGVVERPMGEGGRVTGRRANGQEFAAEATIVRVETAGECGPRPVYAALLRDLSQEHSLSAELHSLQRRYRLVFEMAPVGFCVVEGERIVAANRACENLFDRRDDETLQGLSILELLDLDSRSVLSPLMARAIERHAGEPLVNECMVGLAGRDRKLAVRLAALPEPGHTGVQLMFSDVTHSSAERIELAQSRHDLRRLSASVVQSRENARLRIARELHDELGQRLSALKLDLSSLDPAAGRITYDERVASMLAMLDDTMLSVRRIISDLRPLMLDDLGLNAAVDWLARESARRMGIEVTVRLGERDPALDKDTAIAVYRMVQEALTNVGRHARASEVRIDLREASGELVLTVQDNGIGFANGAMRKAGSFGLFGVRERAYALGGSMEAGNPGAGGARLCVRLPLRRAHEGRARPSG
jgi:two-component system, NarL family, sensor histidine kinase UhpB